MKNVSPPVASDQPDRYADDESHAAIVCGAPVGALVMRTVRPGEGTVGRWRSRARSCSPAGPRSRWRAAAVRAKEAAVAAPRRVCGLGGRARRSSRWTRATATSTAFLFAAHPRAVREAIDRHRRGFDAGAERRTCTSTRRRPRRRVRRSAAGYLGVNAGASSRSPTRRRWGSRWSTAGCSRPATRSSPPSTTTTRPTSRCGWRARRCARSASTTIRRRPPPTTMIDAIARRDHAAHEGRRGHLGALGDRREAAGREARAALRRNRRCWCVDGVHALGVEPEPMASTSATSSWPAPTSGSAARAAPA